MSIAVRSCACGCGVEIEPRYASGKPRYSKFVPGHHQNGQPLSEAKKLAVSQARKKQFEMAYPEALKDCKRCGNTFDLEHFFFGNKWREFCQLCHRQVTRRYYALRKYDLTGEQFDELMQVKNCAICGIHEDEAERGCLHIEHDHQTNRVRGMVCSACNRGLGGFGDDVQRLLAAVAYLEAR